MSKSSFSSERLPDQKRVQTTPTHRKPQLHRIPSLALSKTAPRQTTSIVTIPLLRVRTTAKRSTPRSPDNATAAQAGIEKMLYDGLHKVLNYAAKSLAAIAEQERLNLSEAELAYQNAIYLSEQSSTPPESPMNQQQNDRIRGIPYELIGCNTLQVSDAAKSLPS